MTAPEPRKSLWELMRHQPAEGETPPAAQPPADTPLEEPGGDPVSEHAARDAARGKSLWAVMQQSDRPDDTPPSVVTDNAVADEMRAAFEAPVKPADKRLRQMAETELEVEIVNEPADHLPAKRLDKRLRQGAELEVEIVDEPPAADSPPTRNKTDKRLQQLTAPDVDVVDESSEELTADDVTLQPRPTAASSTVEQRSRSGIRGIPSPLAARPLPAAADVAIASIPVETHPRLLSGRAGRSRTAQWSILLGIVSLPISLVAIFPAIWSRIPGSVCGFGAMVLGFLALGELQRIRGHRGRDQILAYSGIALGLLAMFSGPLIYAPLDIYGQLSDSYTQGHLQQIGLATENYSQQQHGYPSGGQFQEVASGQELQPMHGWMTLLLPYLPEGPGLAKQLDLSKPYSDLVNQPVMSQMVAPFLAAGGNLQLVQDKYGPAHFAGVGGLISLPDGSVAHAGIFDVNSQTNREDVIDGLSNTVIAGEISNRYPAWGEPHNWRQFGKGLNRDPDGFGNARHTGALCLMADGSVRFLPNATDPKILEALSTRDGEDQP